MFVPKERTISNHLSDLLSSAEDEHRQLNLSSQKQNKTFGKTLWLSRRTQMVLNQCACVWCVKMCFVGNWFCGSDSRGVVFVLEKSAWW